MDAQEKQREKDDALVAFIRTARERRDRERELELQDQAQLQRREEQAALFYELGSSRAHLACRVTILLCICSDYRGCLMS